MVGSKIYLATASHTPMNDPFWNPKGVKPRKSVSRLRQEQLRVLGLRKPNKTSAEFFGLAGDNPSILYRHHATNRA